jgi:hypothetical protein
MGAVWMRLKFERRSVKQANGKNETRYALVPEFHLAH